VKLLLDTHAFIWLNTQPSRLSTKVVELLSSGIHDVYLSMASPWEMQIKSQLGKLLLNLSLDELIEISINTNNINILPIEFKHISYLSKLPLHHNDPFDRIIIAQALSENMTVISADSAFSQYQVPLIW
jgi:PIN domain nuclease of toxin-antitoxin system